MTAFNLLPDVVFVDADKEKVQTEIIGLYEKTTGRNLAQGDPVRLFINTIADVIIQQRELINYTGKQNLLRYADGVNLDHLGALIGVERIPAAAASTTLKFTLSEIRSSAVTIPRGTRATAGDDVYFALDKNLIIPAGELFASGPATCMETGTIGNGYSIGELSTLVDPQPFVKSVTNITFSEGGADIEADESFREAIHIAPEKFSTAGPVGAYEYHAKRASALISDVAVVSPVPGDVMITPLLEGGVIPGEEILQDVLAVCNDRTVRPLTDHVYVEAPKEKEYTVNVKYFISVDDEARASGIQTAVETAVDAFVGWQKQRLGRDVNPSELIRRIMEEGAKRVELTQPEYAVTGATEVAICKDKVVELGGMESE